MIVKELTHNLSVSGQLAPSDIAEIANLGFKSIISNRPDSEGEDQPTFSEIAREAHLFGIEVRYIPVVSGKLSDQDASAFAAAVEALPKPVLAFCRTGTRCTMLWALTQVGARAVEDILQTAQVAGYDLKGLEPRLRASAPSHDKAID
ncbi:MAG: TIGR01244 family phosphatase [Proteobacteria bacterium]|nr:TIGR01244 family phosphatase [Pseudomonadota bacterium]